MRTSGGKADRREENDQQAIAPIERERNLAAGDEIEDAEGNRGEDTPVTGSGMFHSRSGATWRLSQRPQEKHQNGENQGLPLIEFHVGRACGRVWQNGSGRRPGEPGARVEGVASESSRRGWLRSLRRRCGNEDRSRARDGRGARQSNGRWQRDALLPQW